MTAPTAPVNADAGFPDPEHIAAVLDRELKRFVAEHPVAAGHHDADDAMLGGVPMPWMRRWAGGFPVIAAHAEGARITDTDGHQYVDFCLGDTGAMTGHAPAPVVAAASARLAAGTTMMLPTDDAAVAAASLRDRFGLDRWMFTLSATDANRAAIRFARHLTRRDKILCFSYSYHGAVDETLAVRAAHGRTVAREGNVGAPVDLDVTTRAVEFNDLAALEEALAHGDVALVIAEPAMTNMGIILPDGGYHAELRRLTREHGTLLLIDETHTFSVGPAGATGAWGLEPDMFTIGKAIAGGVPAGALGVTRRIADELLDDPEADLEDVGGIGGTLAGNALSLAAMRAALTEVLTPAAFAHATAVADRLLAGMNAVIAKHRLRWHALQLGCRVEYRFVADPPRDGTASYATLNAELERVMHLHALNRGVLITPFHNMLLACPATTMADADLHTEVFEAAVVDLFA
ncbi:MAG TPA: transaminase [Baekduia sp.]|uniref:transaminase n=1 Tax=Baekduia sp. TaxID=2600305 RepID=UPI002C623477|nr:transaminase [Baekduia sp.]HMJ35148.1 transaminase [Baekduia sp.]